MKWNESHTVTTVIGPLTIFITVMNTLSIGYPTDIVIFKYILWISMDMEIRLKLRKVGNSLMIAIPSQIVKDLKLKAGDDMLLDIIDSTISVRKERR
jgi:hypothetical protein